MGENIIKPSPPHQTQFQSCFGVVGLGIQFLVGFFCGGGEFFSFSGGKEESEEIENENGAKNNKN